MLSCVPSRSLSEYGMAVKLATGSSAGLYFFQAAVISSMVFCTSSPLPKPAMLTLPPALRDEVEVSNCCVARFRDSIESRTKPRARRRYWMEFKATCMREGCCCNSPMARTAVLFSTSRPAKYQAGARTPTRNASARMPTATHTARAPCMRDEMVLPVFSVFPVFFTITPPSLRLEHDALDGQARLGRSEFLEPRAFHRLDGGRVAHARGFGREHAHALGAAFRRHVELDAHPAFHAVGGSRVLRTRRARHLERRQFRGGSGSGGLLLGGSERASDFPEIGVAAEALGRVDERRRLAGTAGRQAGTGITEQSRANVAHHLHGGRVTRVQQPQALGIRHRRIIGGSQQAARGHAVLGGLREARDVVIGALLLLRSGGDL